MSSKGEVEVTIFFMSKSIIFTVYTINVCLIDVLFAIFLLYFCLEIVSNLEITKICLLKKVCQDY